MIPDRRTLIVLASLVAAMTFASGLLFLLEPTPGRFPGTLPGSSPGSFPGGSPGSFSGRSSAKIRLAVVEPTSDPQREGPLKLDPRVPPNAWSAIVVREASASPGEFNGKESANGFHFWIQNTSEGSDGRIIVGQPWQNQQRSTALGATLDGQTTEPVVSGIHLGSAETVDQAITINVSCDPDRSGPSEQQLHALIWLVQRLQARFNLPAEAVTYQFEAPAAGSEGRLSPVAWFRQQLLTYGTP